MTTTLAEQLLVWIAEDEAVARAATPGPWRYYPGSCAEIENDEEVPVVYNPEDAATNVEDARHIALHDPAHVLAVCAAHRRVLQMHSAQHVCAPADFENDIISEPWFEAADRAPAWAKPCPTLFALAQPYRGRDGWRESWTHETARQSED